MLCRGMQGRRLQHQEMGQGPGVPQKDTTKEPSFTSLGLGGGALLLPCGRHFAQEMDRAGKNMVSNGIVVEPDLSLVLV